MSDKYITYQQHEPLRVPEGWNTQEKKFVGQLEEILDDIYRRFGRLRISDFSKEVRADIEDSAAGVAELRTEVEQQAGEIALRATRTEVQAGLDGKLNTDAPSVGVTNSAVVIDPDGIDLSTSENGQIVSRVGDDIELQIDKDGVTGKKGVFDSLEAPNVVGMYPGGYATWMGTIQATIDSLPKYLKADTYITVPAGVYPEDILIKGFKGAMLIIQTAEKITINGSITILDCDRVSIFSSVLGWFKVYPRTPVSIVVGAVNVGRLEMTAINVSGYRDRTASEYSNYCVFLSATHIAFSRCVFEYSNAAAIDANDSSSGYINDCFGGGSGNTNLGYALISAHGSYLGLNGDRYILSNSGNTLYNGRIDTLDALTPTAGGIDYSPPSEYTQSFNISKHCTYLLAWSRTPDTNANSMTQGSYRGTGGNTRFNAGVMWFSGATAALAGKTIVSAQLTIRRSNGGYSNPVPVWLCSTTLTEANYNTTYEPDLTTPTNVGSLDKQSSGTYDVTSLMGAIQAGGGIAIYEPKNTTVTDTWSPAYTHFYGHGSNYEPVLTVKYR